MAASKDDSDLDPTERADDAKPKKRAKRDDTDDERDERDEKPKKKPRRDTDDDDERDEEPKKKKAPARAEDDDEEKPPRRRAKKLGDRKVPYPPSPENVPEGLTEYPESFKKQQQKLLAGLILFLIFYIGAILFTALVGIWCVWSLGHLFPLKVIGIVFSSVTFLFLVKGFFKRHAMDKEMHIEITEDEQPVLFDFIYRLCDELDAPLPNKVFVSPDVNAAVMPRTSLVNLFKEPKKDLLIGLGLVNCMNLTEFKSVLAHEFGHFSQSAVSTSYSYVANRIIIDLIAGEDWFDRFLDWCKEQKNALSVIGYGFGGPLWLGRKILWWLFKIITLQRMAVMRESEFHADLMAVKAGGSDAVVLSLFRLRFGNICLGQAVQDMKVAMDHKLHSNDMFLHQDRAATVVRRKRKEPELGVPPEHAHPMAGKTIRVFDPADEDSTDEVPEMRRTHPPAHELEDNAKKEYIPAVVDHRSPWILFENGADLRERMTYKFYRMAFKIPKNTELADALTVQKFIDNEHSETTYDPKYKGCYDDRPLEPGELAELNGIVRDKPWDDDRMEKVYEKLYDGCEKHAETHSELYKELQALRAGIVGRPSPKMKRKMEDLEKQQDENWEWFKSFDRRVYLLHVQMAKQVDKELKDELVERYRFQLEVQRLYQESRQAFNKADAYLDALGAANRGQFTPGPDFITEVLAVLRESWKALRNIMKDARDIALPAMKNFEEGENLAAFILEGKMVPEPPLSYAKGEWIVKLMRQLEGVRQKCFRLHFKSVGGILAIQEKIAAAWLKQREPVAAEVLDPEPVAAEIVAAEVLPANVTAAEVIAAEVVAEVLPPAAAPEPPEAVAAPPVFVAPVPAPAPEPAPVPAVAARAPDPHAPPVEPEIVAAVVIEPEVVAAEVVEPEVVAAEVVEPEPAAAPKPPEPAATVAYEPEPVFSLDALNAAPSPAPPKSEAPTIAAVAKPAPAPAKPVADDQVFSLDADEPKPAAPAATAPVEVPFSLDADDHKPAAKSAPVPAPAVREPEPEPVLSGVAPTPAVRTVPATVKPATAQRPALKITLVRPGEKSPLAK